MYKHLRCLLVSLLTVETPIVPAMALELDVNALEQALKDNPNDAASSILLARHYLSQNKLEQADGILARLPVTDATVARLRQQIAATQKHSALLRSLDVDNPFLTTSLDHAITPLENQSTDVIRAFFAFLETNEFRYSERLRELFAIFFNTQKDFTQALSIASKAKHAHGDTWLTIKADSCEGLGQHKCATANHQQRWEQNKELDVGSRAVQYYLRQGNLQTADNLLTEMENLWEDHPEILALRSELNVQLESSGNKQVTLSINPGDTALRSLVSALYDNGQHEAALTALEVALSKFSPNDHTRIFAAQRFAWSGEYEKALSQLNQITVSTPESRLLQGQIYAWSGKFDDAEQLLSDLINEQPAQHIVDIAQMMRGFSEHWAGNSESAVKRFEPLMESTTEGLDKPAMAEVIKIAKGDYTDAIARLQAQLERQPKEPRPLLELAGIFERQGKTAKAIAVFEQYLAKAPDDHASRRRLAHIYFSQSQHNTGLIHLERYAFAVFTPESLTELAQNFFWVGDKAVAARVLRQRDHSFANTDHLWRFDANKTSSLAGTQAPLKASNNTEAQVLKQAQAKFNNDEFKAAAALLDQHLKTHPHDMYAHRLYAFTLSRLARFTEAASEFYVVSRSHLVSDDIFFHYGYNLARSGNYLAAKKVLRRLERHLVEALGEPSPNASDSLEKGIPAHLSDFISQWKAHWEARNFADYSRHYSEKIRTDQRWQAHKQTSFSRNSAIAVRVSDLHLLSKSQQGTAHHYRVRFTQDYTATTMKDRGEKTLSLLCAQNQPCLITQESWRPIKANVSQDAERVRLKISLLKQTRDELAKLDVQAKQPTQLDKVVNGMVFSQGVERFPKPEYEVLSVDPVSKMKGLNSPDASKVGWLARDLEIPYEDYGSQALVEDKQHVSLSTQHVSDSSSMGYRTLGVSANLLHKSGIMNVSADRYRFSHDDCAPQTGHRADANWTQAGYTVGTRVDSLNRKTLLSPYAGLTTQDDDRSQTWRAGVDTLFFDKLSCDTHRHQQRRVSIAYEHYAPVSIPFMADLWPKTHSVGAEPTSTPFTLWFGLQAGAIDDGNKEAIGQFDLSRALFSGDKVSTSLGLSGWYMFNSRPTDAYYSPKHYDSQTIRVDSEYLLTNNFRFKADARTGYSFDAQRVLYGAGLSAHYQAGFGASAELACRRNNTGGTGKTSAHFSTSQCSLIAGYAW